MESWEKHGRMGGRDKNSSYEGGHGKLSLMEGSGSGCRLPIPIAEELGIIESAYLEKTRTFGRPQTRFVVLTSRRLYW